MSANKLFFMTVVLLGLGALVAGCGSDTVFPTDEAPILPPENLTATPASESVTLNWNPSPYPSVAGYTVYRVQMNTHDQVKLTASPIQATTYTDNSVRRGVAYEYQVTAMTKAGKESVCASIQAILRLSVHDPGVNED